MHIKSISRLVRKKEPITAGLHGQVFHTQWVTRRFKIGNASKPERRTRIDCSASDCSELR